DRLPARGLQPLLDRGRDQLRPALACAAVARLGGDEHVVGAGECLADGAFAVAPAVQGRRVDGAPARGHGLADERHVVGGEPVGAEADAGDVDAGESVRGHWLSGTNWLAMNVAP